MADRNTARECHLTKQNNSASSWKFLRGDFSEYLSNTTQRNKQALLKALLDRLSTPDNIESDLHRIISTFDEKLVAPKHAWIVPFIKHDLFNIRLGDYRFYNCVYLNGNDILLLTTTTERGFNMEINTFLLYQKLIDLGLKNIKLTLGTTSIMLDEKHFPKRYIKYKGYKIGYLTAPKAKYVVQQGETTSEYELNDLIPFILAL